MGCGASTPSPSRQASPARPYRAEPAPKVVADPKAARLREVFQLIDKDRNGSIDLKEFMLTASATDTTSDLKIMFEFIDCQVKSDGLITEEEWVTGVRQLFVSDEEFEKAMNRMMYALAAAAMAGQSYDTAASASADVDYEAGFREAGGHDRVDAASWSASCMERSTARAQLLRAVFTAMDVDGDGNVDLAEFKRSARTKGEADDELPILFEFVLDTSGDGKLSYEEWAHGMDQLRPDDGTDKSHAIFEKEMRTMLETLTRANADSATAVSCPAATAEAPAADAPAADAPAAEAPAAEAASDLS